MADTYWTDLPTSLHPQTIPILTGFVFRQEIPSKGTAVLVGLNLVGYGANQLGLSDGPAATAATVAAATSQEDEQAAVQALEAYLTQSPDGVAALPLSAIPWGTLIRIAIRLLQAAA